MRFDEVELEAVPLGGIDHAVESVDETDASPLSGEAPWWRRSLALLTDLSLFAALTLALSPLLPQPLTWTAGSALAGFAVVLSYYYFVGSWLLWGKTIGGAIFEVRRPLMNLRDASKRWAIGLLAITAFATVIALAWMARSVST